MTTEQPLILTNRLYKYIKSSAILGLIHAGVELLTNSHDAYLKSNLLPEYKIDVVVDYKERKMIVYDQAIGLTSEEMVKNFGQVGDYTSEIFARGYFSRGAKDISAIGNVTFVGIKNNKISKVSLHTNDMFYIHSRDLDVTPEDRETYKIVNNGLYVCLDVKDSVTFPSYREMAGISKYFSMRDIFTDKNFNVNIQVLNELGVEIHNDRLQYVQSPIKETLIDQEYSIEGYPGVTAKFKVFLYEEPVTDSDNGSYQEHGIIVASGNAIHEISTLYNDISGHPYIRHIVGRIDCEYINQLMYDFDANPDDILNPFPILDHSRMNGLDRSHPFTKALFRLPRYELKYILQELNNIGLSESNLNNDLSNLFQNVSIFGEGFFKEMLDTIQEYTLAEKSRTVGFLMKKGTKDIISSSSNATYNFKEPSTFIQNPGNITINEPKLHVVFTEKDYMEYPYYIYRIDNLITLEININDFLVSKCVQRDPDTTEIKFTNRSAAEIMLIEIISEALAREAIKSKTGTSRDTQLLAPASSEEVFSELEKLKNILVPKLYTIITVNNMDSISFS
jgi:hypothetical protein